jgi:para-nitrobenzyl esterase
MVLDALLGLVPLVLPIFLLPSEYQTSILSYLGMRPLPPGPNVYGPYRYATAERFGVPSLVTNLVPVAPALCPQNASAFEAYTGPPQPLPQSEDCLQVVVYAKSSPRKRWDAENRHPVMVFIHGGAYLVGGGVLDMYDGLRLAAEDVVVVNVNYRLGALGFLKTKGGDTLNGHRDVLTALRWVKEHATDFGGDPEAVTVFGQSAGALSVGALYRDHGAKDLFRAGIMQSAPLALVNRSHADALAANFTAALGQDPHTASIDDILAAQAQVTAEDPVAFFPEVTGDIHPHPLVAGWNAGDGAPGAPEEQQAGFRETLYAAPTRAFADEVRARGADVGVYLFQNAGWGDFHGAELPLLLGKQEAFAVFPPGVNETWHKADETGRPMRQAWPNFARQPDPKAAKTQEGLWFLDWLD